MRSLSLDAAFFDSLSLQPQGGGGGAGSGGVAGHKRSGSMDSSSSPFEGESALSGVLPDYAKKAVPAERLAELALLDPKRAKRSGEFLSATASLSFSHLEKRRGGKQC
jgi:transcription factor VIP1